MTRLTLTTNALTGIKEIDEQHQSLIDLINDLDEAIASRSGHEIIGSAIQGMVEYTQSHLAFEEELMQENQHSGLEQHQKGNKKIIKQMSVFQKMYKNGITSIETEILHCIKDWITKHIQKADMDSSSEKTAPATPGLKRVSTKIELTADCLTGITDIDDQHQVLVDITNELVEAILEGHPHEQVGETISRLAEYTQIHFKNEEALMEKYNYAQLEQHKQGHEKLIKQLHKFHDMHSRGIDGISAEIPHFFKDWLINHIKTSDMEYVPFVKKGEKMPVNMH